MYIEIKYTWCTEGKEACLLTFKAPFTTIVHQDQAAQNDLHCPL